MCVFRSHHSALIVRLCERVFVCWCESVVVAVCVLRLTGGVFLF